MKKSLLGIIVSAIAIALGFSSCKDCEMCLTYSKSGNTYTICESDGHSVTYLENEAADLPNYGWETNLEKVCN